MAELAGEEVFHIAVGLFCFWKADVVPECVREAFEDYEPGVVAVADEGAMEDSCSAEEKVAATGDEECGRHVVEIGEEGRDNGVLGICAADVFEVEGLLIGDGESAGEAAEAVHCLRVSGTAEVAQAGEDAQGCRKREFELLEADGYLGGENGSGRGSIEGDVGRLVGFEEFAIDDYGVVDGGWKWVLGGEAVKNADDAGVGEVGDRNALGEGA